MQTVELKSKGENMKAFKVTAAQGDVYFTRINTGVPDNAKLVQPENGKLIVTHSETGHHHVVDASKAKMYSLPDDIMKCLLVVDQPVVLEHLRHYDTHEPILFTPGTYLVRRQREYTPAGWRKAQD